MVRGVIRMQNKNVKLIALVCLLILFCVPSTLSLIKRIIGSSGMINTATWSVALNQTGVNNSLQVMYDNLNANYTLNVTSTSDVDVQYTIVVRNIPSGVEVKLDNGSFQTPSNNVVTFNNAGSIYYSDVSKEKTHVLTFKANNGATVVNNQTVTVDVDFKQM